MKIEEYFKKTLEDLFLYSKHITTEQYQNILNEYCKGAAKCVREEIVEGNKRVIIIFDFEMIVFTYALTIGEGRCFEKVISIDYIENKE